MLLVGRPVGPIANELDVERGVFDVLEGTVDCEEALTVDAVVGLGAMTGAEVGDIAGVEAGLAGAAVFWKQAHALDRREVDTPAKLLGIASAGFLRYLGQKTAASLEKRSKARRLLSS